MKTLTTCFLIAIALGGCATKLAAPNAAAPTPSGPTPTAQGDIDRECAQIRKETTDLVEEEEGVPAYTSTDPEAIAFEDSARKKDAELEALAASLHCAAAGGAGAQAAQMPSAPGQPVAVQPVSKLMPMTFDQCFEKCRQFTDRSKDQCFDSCKK